MTKDENNIDKTSLLLYTLLKSAKQLGIIQMINTLGNNNNNTEISLQEIAEHSGISLSTAYRIIRGDAKIRTDKHRTAKRLLQNAGYIKSDDSESLTFLLVGSVYDTACDVTFYNTIGQESIKNNIKLLQCDVDNMENVIGDNRVDGVLSFRTFENLSVPYVTINYDAILPSYSGVQCDERLGIGMVFEYLLSKGHKRIGFFDDYASSGDRYSLRRGIGHIPYYYHASGADYDPELIYSEYVEPMGHTPVIKRAVKHFIGLKNPPTAIVLPGDCYALCFYDELKSAGLNVPDDISITGFDNENNVKYLNPPLTTIAKPFEKMIEMAIKLLIEKINKPDNPEVKISIEPKLVIRNSVRDIRGG
jgi:DNA-binding LacI/PurR family transcriptional regulator